MTAIADAAFALLRSAISSSSETVELSTDEWWTLFRLMQKGHVAALCADAAIASAPPREVMLPWLAEREKVSEWHKYQQSVQTDIINIMRSKGIDTLVLKGTHTAIYYPIPTLREFGDLDLYFFSRHSEADNVARRQLHVDISRNSHHHTKYNYRGVTIESHYDFVNTHYPFSNRRFEQLLKQLSPSATFEVLFLLRHAAVHFASDSITLRDLVDIVLTCRALNSEVNWQMVGDVVSDYGMQPFVSAICTISSNRLGDELPLNMPPCDAIPIENNIISGNKLPEEPVSGSFMRLGWKISRWRAGEWRRRMVYNDSAVALIAASIISHTLRPHSILHKV